MRDELHVQHDEISFSMPIGSCWLVICNGRDCALYMQHEGSMSRLQALMLTTPRGVGISPIRYFIGVNFWENCVFPSESAV